MKVSVIIPVFNEEKYIEACLKSFFKQTVPPDEIIVVDNNCTDNTITLTKQFPGIRIVKETTQGMTPARNKGFNSAKYDIIARTDADTIVPREWLATIKKHFEKDSNLIALSGPSRWSGITPLQAQTYFQAVLLNFASFKKLFHYDVLYGPNMAIRKTAWKQVAKDVCLTDNIVHEDIDLAMHIKAYGKILNDIHDKKLVVTSSARRWKKAKSYIEYPYRYLRTIQHHKQSLHGIKLGSQMVGKALPRPKRILKSIRSSASASVKFAKSLAQ